MADKQTHQHKFKAEVKQLLDILAHSLYTNREIFLRELISNASDALEKVRYEMLTGVEVYDKDLPLEIKIEMNKETAILTISDSGIGMTEQELINNIGTIAKSGTAEFLKNVAQDKKDSTNIIGKFGVGFYAVFMVAKEVTITTRSYLPEAAAVLWRSEGTGTFEIQVLPEKISRGTQIEIQLKDDAREFAEKWKLEQVIQKHSNFIAFPIKIEKEQVNKVRAIWREPKFQLKQKEYDEFYKFMTYDSESPLETIHITIDAPVQYNALLFIPVKNYDWAGLGKSEHGLDLYVKRVLIQHENKDLLPEYLQFIRGVVDSEDVPLNISRETLQENQIIIKIKNNLVSQILAQLAKLAQDDSKKYNQYWKEFNHQFKLGYNDYAQREKFAELLRFNSSACKQEEELISLTEYASRLKPDQKEIYYSFAPNRQSILTNPHLEIFKKKGVEVLYLYDPIDEFVLEGLGTFKDFKLRSVEQADLQEVQKFADQMEETKVADLNAEELKSFDKLLRRMKDILGERVTDVKESKRLTDSPVCLVSPDGGITSTMQRIMQIMNKDVTLPKRLMEVNRDHPLIRNLIKIYQHDPKADHLTSVTEQLFESSLLLEGYLQDATQMVRRIEILLEKSTELYMEKIG
jgi:molecular chaperone HtpG